MHFLQAHCGVNSQNKERFFSLLEYFLYFIWLRTSLYILDITKKCALIRKIFFAHLFWLIVPIICRFFLSHVHRVCENTWSILYNAYLSIYLTCEANLLLTRLTSVLLFLSLLVSVIARVTATDGGAFILITNGINWIFGSIVQKFVCIGKA